MKTHKLESLVFVIKTIINWNISKLFCIYYRYLTIQDLSTGIKTLTLSTVFSMQSIWSTRLLFNHYHKDNQLVDFSRIILSAQVLIFKYILSMSISPILLENDKARQSRYQKTMSKSEKDDEQSRKILNVFSYQWSFPYFRRKTSLSLIRIKKGHYPHTFAFIEP